MAAIYGPFLASFITGIVLGKNGGTGVANAGKTLTFPEAAGTAVTVNTLAGGTLTAKATTLTAVGQISSVANSSMIVDFVTGGDNGRILAANSSGTFTTPIQVINPLTATSGLAVTGALVLGTFTVATLPTATAGATAYVTNALGPVFGSAVVGGGAVAVPVYSDGATWRVG